MPAKCPTIMVIRHGEKPDGELTGVDESGASSNHSLIVRGWQRAGALSCLLAPARGPLQSELLAIPEYIFASAPVSLDGSTAKSSRPKETATPLAQLLGLEINESFGKGQEDALVSAVKACNAPALIVWQHESISTIANAILGSELAPQVWPGDRFDVLFVFTLDTTSDTYSFAQVTQRLLAGDSSTQI